MYHIKLATWSPYMKFKNLPPRQTIILVTLLIIFHYRNKYEHWFFTKVLRTRDLYERHVIERHLSDNRHLKIMFHYIFHWLLCYFIRGGITFPLNYTCLSTEWAMASFCLHLIRINNQPNNSQSEILGTAL